MKRALPRYYNISVALPASVVTRIGKTVGKDLRDWLIAMAVDEYLATTTREEIRRLAAMARERQEILSDVWRQFDEFAETL